MNQTSEIFALLSVFLYVSLAEDLSGYFNSSDYQEADNADYLDAEIEIQMIKAGERNESEYIACPYANYDPCECSITFEPDNGQRRFSVVCSFFNDTNIFKEMMNKLRRAKVINLKTLFIQRSNITLPIEGLFDNLLFSSLHVTKAKIEIPKENDTRTPNQYRALLGGLEESLIEVNFRNCELNGVKWKGCALGALPNIKRFSLTNSGIGEIPKEFFCCSYIHIEEIYLYNNAFERLEGGTLSRATRLKLINLNNNKIFLLSRNFLPFPADALEEIHLRNNQIGTLPSDFFVEMPLLRYVDISENKLEHLPILLWRPVWRNLVDVYLEGNNIVCDCTLRWLPHQEETKLSSHFKSQRFLRGSCSSIENNITNLSLDEIDSLLLPQCSGLSESATTI